MGHLKNKLSSWGISTMMTVMFAAFSLTCDAGGGWPQPKGKGYFKLYEWWSVADQHYTGNGLKDPNITSGLYNTMLYGEFGFSSRLTGVMNIPLLSRAVTNNLVSSVTQNVLMEGAAINAPGDIQLALKYGVYSSSRVSVSTTLEFGIPTGEDAGGPERNLQTGDGEFNQLLRLDAGIPILGSKTVSMYGNLYGGFNKRNKGFSDEYRFGAELGIGLINQKLYIIGRYDAVESRNNKPNGPIQGGSFFANNYEVHGLSAELSYEFTKGVGVAFGYSTAISGKIIYAAPAYTVGVFLKL